MPIGQSTQQRLLINYKREEAGLKEATDHTCRWKGVEPDIWSAGIFKTQLCHSRWTNVSACRSAGQSQAQPIPYDTVEKQMT